MNIRGQLIMKHLMFVFFIFFIGFLASCSSDSGGSESNEEDNNPYSVLSVAPIPTTFNDMPDASFISSRTKHYVALYSVLENYILTLKGLDANCVGDVSHTTCTVDFYAVVDNKEYDVEALRKYDEIEFTVAPNSYFEKTVPSERVFNIIFPRIDGYMFMDGYAAFVLFSNDSKKVDYRDSYTNALIAIGYEEDQINTYGFDYSYKKAINDYVTAYVGVTDISSNLAVSIHIEIDKICRYSPKLTGCP
jgi:hypothetical protein